MMNDLPGDCVQLVTDRCGAMAFPLRRQNHAQQRQQVVGDRTQLEISRIGREVAAGQIRSREITAQLFQSVSLASARWL